MSIIRPLIYTDGTTKEEVHLHPNTEVAAIIDLEDRLTALLDNTALTGVPTAPTAAAGTNDTQVATTEYVDAAVATLQAAVSNGVIVRGTLGTDGTHTNLPQSDYEIGDMYVVATAGLYAGQECEVGDTIICISTAGNGAADWAVIQANIERGVSGPASSVNGHIATFTGTSGKILADSGYTIEDVVYVHPESGADEGEYDKVTVDTNGHVTSGKALSAEEKLLETGITSTAINIDRMVVLAANIPDMMNRHTKLRTIVAKHNDRITTLEETAESHDDTLELLTGRIDGHDSDITTLTERADGHDTDISGIKETLDAILEQQSAFNQSVVGFQAQLNAQQAQLNAMNERMAYLEQALEDCCSGSGSGDGGTTTPDPDPEPETPEPEEPEDPGTGDTGDTGDTDYATQIAELNVRLEALAESATYVTAPTTLSGTADDATVAEQVATLRTQLATLADELAYVNDAPADIAASSDAEIAEQIADITTYITALEAAVAYWNEVASSL